MSSKELDSSARRPEIAEIEKKRFVNTKELAAYLGVSPAWVSVAATNKIISYIQAPGSARRFELREVIEEYKKKYKVKAE